MTLMMRASTMWKNLERSKPHQVNNLIKVEIINSMIPL